MLFFLLLIILFFNSTPLSTIYIYSYHSYIFSIMKESHIAYPFTKPLIIYL